MREREIEKEKERERDRERERERERRDTFVIPNIEHTILTSDIVMRL